MISFAVPAYNEEKFIKNTIDTIIEAVNITEITHYEIIIINDGSNDNTGNIINRLSLNNKDIKTIHHKQNKGLGCSIKEAICVAQYEKFIFVPGDNDLPKTSIRDLIINRNKADIVMLYILNKEIRGRRRTVISLVYGIIYMLTFNVFVQYLQGPCVYPLKKLREIDIFSNRFTIMAEVNLKILKTGVTFYEIPGYTQTGAKGSTALSLKNFLEVVMGYVRLFWEIKISKKRIYNKYPVRVY